MRRIERSMGLIIDGQISLAPVHGHISAELLHGVTSHIGFIIGDIPHGNIDILVNLTNR